MKIPYGLIISFIAGAAAGVLATYKYFDKLHRDRADEEIASVKQKLCAIYGQKDVASSYPDCRDMTDIDDIKAKMNKKFGISSDQNTNSDTLYEKRRYSTEQEKPSPSELVHSNSKESDEEILDDFREDEEEMNLDAANTAELDDNLNKIFIISDYDYYNNGSNDYEKATLIYYEGDDTLADERDEIVDDVRGTIGTNDPDELFDQDDRYVYVRNNRLGTDYEIERVEGSYQEAVYGYIPPSGRNTKKARERAKREEG